MGFDFAILWFEVSKYVLGVDRVRSWIIVVKKDLVDLETTIDNRWSLEILHCVKMQNLRS